MKFRFRKSKKLLPGVRLNITNKGISTTLGPRGASIGVGKRGVYGNVGIPGTGISGRQKLADGFGVPGALVLIGLAGVGGIMVLALVITVGLMMFAPRSSGKPQVAAAATTPTPLPAASLTGKVVGVTDGDTITVLDDSKQQHKIRLAGIDAPESGQDFGTKAKQNLSALVFGRTVMVYGDKIDRYGRRVGKVLVDGRDAGLEQINAGYAWHFKKYEGEQSLQDRSSYMAAESKAENAKMNLWSGKDPIPPWDYRDGVRTRATTKSPPVAPPPVSTAPVPLYSAPRGANGPSQSGYIRGPRGGCYYINSRGNKTYVDRSLCD